jgi:delta-aminolevulinic acid dehydratase/porphobilinogen synthase
MGQCLRTACLLLLVVTSILGASSRNAMAMEADAITRARLSLSQDCQPAAIVDLSGVVCDADGEVPARMPNCPMMNVCLNMGTGSGHCGLVTVSDVSIVPDASTCAVPVVFLSSAVQRSGLVADPVFHPPIL